MPQVTHAATAGLQGWRQKVGDTVAGPVAGRSPLSEEQVRAIVGAIFFVLEKLAAVTGVSNLHVYAAMRGQSLDDFQKTRNAQMLYSVGGQEAQEKLAQTRS